MAFFKKKKKKKEKKKKKKKEKNQKLSKEFTTKFIRHCCHPFMLDI